MEGSGCGLFLEFIVAGTILFSLYSLFIGFDIFRSLARDGVLCYFGIHSFDSFPQDGVNNLKKCSFCKKLKWPKKIK